MAKPRNPSRLYILIELREAADINQEAMARLCGLQGRQSRKTVAAWELGTATPAVRHRPRLIGYLWDALGLRHDPAKFDEVWEILVEEWEWEPISDAEWRSFTQMARPVTRAAPTQTTPHLPAQLPLPPEPDQPPLPPAFIGRQQELSAYAQALTTTRLAVISGPPGVGKTTLAARLARQMVAPERIFWHSFHAGEGVHALVWRLAGFLARQQHETVWRMLQSAQQTGATLPPQEVLLDYLLTACIGQNYLICLDDFHHVADDPLVNRLLQGLRTTAAAGQLWIVITSRQMPDFVPTSGFAPLAGLSAADTAQLVQTHALALSTAQVNQLHSLTAGNVQILLLALERLRTTRDPARLLARLAQTDDIERYLMKQVHDHLSPAEQAVMKAVAVLQDYAGTRAALEAILGEGSLQVALLRLGERHLLLVSEGEWAREYRQHAIVQTFYYSLLSRVEQQAMHRRAAAYYTAEEPDPLRGILHFTLAAVYEPAAQLLTAHSQALINRGHARTLQRLLGQLENREFSPELQAQFHLTRGQIYALVGESDQAQQAYQAALAGFHSLPDQPASHTWRATTYRWLADLLQHSDPATALAQLQAGLQEVRGRDRSEEAALHIKIGSLHIAQGAYSAALAAVHQGLALLPETPSPQRVSAYINLSTLHYAQGDIALARATAQQGLILCEQLADYGQLLSLRSNLAVYKELAGDWEAAMADYAQGIAEAEQLGSVLHQIQFKNNLGLLCTHRGADEAAHVHLTTALALARAHELLDYQVYILCSIADWHSRRGEWQSAEIVLAEAQTLAQQVGAADQQVEIRGLWAQTRWLARDLPQAAALAEQVIAQARTLGVGVVEGKAWRVLGQVYQAQQQTAAAVAALEQSLALLAEERYEWARTKHRLGTLLLATPDQPRGQALLAEAQRTLAALGARPER